MIRGIYTAAASMLCEVIRQDMVADNLANVDTPGFKRVQGIFKELPTMEIRKINDGQLYPPRPFVRYPKIGKLGTGVILDESFTDFSIGKFEHTENPLDCALENPSAFFLAETPQGTRFTRDGIFSLDQDGFLKNMNGDYVLAETEPPETEQKVLIGEDGKEKQKFQRVQVGLQDRMVIDTEGRIVVNGIADLKLLRGSPSDRKAFRKVIQTHDSLLDRAINSVGTSRR
ncbi:flagellar hook-basal body complex protein [bacterium]|nr:flagellar hook-basal body complex protein [bacterium]